MPLSKKTGPCAPLIRSKSAIARDNIRSQNRRESRSCTPCPPDARCWARTSRAGSSTVLNRRAVRSRTMGVLPLPGAPVITKRFLPAFMDLDRARTLIDSLHRFGVSVRRAVHRLLRDPLIEPARVQVRQVDRLLVRARQLVDRVERAGHASLAAEHAEHLAGQ